MSMRYQNTTVSRKTLFTLPASILLFSMAALFLFVLAREASNDAANYEIVWHRLQGADFWDARLAEKYEIGFLLLYWLLAGFLSAGAAFYFIGLSALSVKFYLFKNHLHYPLFAFFIYVSIFLYLLDATEIREGVAVCFVVYALIASKGGKSYLILAAIASLFHLSGLIILLLYFIRAPLIGVASVVLLSFIWESFLESAGILGFALPYSANPEGKVNWTNSLFIMQACISIVCAFQWKGLTVAQKKGAYLLMIGTVCYVAFMGNALLAHRIRELSVLGIFPLLFLGERKLTEARLIVWVCVAYMVVYTWVFVIHKLLVLHSVI